MVDTNYKENFILFIIVLAILALVFISRASSFNVSVEGWDEGMYIQQGVNILHGGIPYREIWDNKGAFLYFLFALIIKLTGHSISGLRIFTALWISVSAVVMFLIGRKLYNNKCGLLAASFFIVAISNAKLLGLESNSEIFFILPVIIAVYNLLFLPLNTARLLLCGFLCGIAFHIKSISIFDTIPILFFIIYSKKIHKAPLPAIVNSIFTFCLGFLIPSIILIYYFWLNGYLNGFLIAYFVEPYRYVGFHFNLSEIAAQMRFNLRLLYSNILILCLLPLVAVLCPYARYKNGAFLILWLFSILLGIFAHHRFWPNVFIQAIPALSLLSTMAFAWLLSLRFQRVSLIILYLGLLVGLIWPIKENLTQLGQRQKNDVCAQVGKYLKTYLGPSDRIFVLNAPIIIYFLADTKVPTRYFYPDIYQKHLMYKEVIHIDPIVEIKNVFYNNPSYVITTDGWVMTSSGELDAFINKYLQMNYLLVNKICTTNIYKYKYSQPVNK